MGTEEIERRILSSASIHQWKYDAFVSFRGEDIRKNFAGHLFHALRQAGIYYFRENDNSETGIIIETKQLDAIRRSRVALVVFTTNYADSRWCLNELVEILECNRRFKDHQGHVVLPIFYDVEPRDVRKQTGRFGDEDVISSLEIGSEDDVRVIGIWGIKGIGKTTVAKVVCDRVFREFEGVSLLENVGDANQDTLLLLQKRLLHDVLKVEGLEMFDLNRNINEIKAKLCHKRILLVLDNITKKDQIEYFGAGDQEWFQHGSRILITTRDEQLLEDVEVDNKYMLPGLTHKESL
ncbi:hypothetical protein EUGRSUZ_H00904 [Eucalyptus grandis]|uniref:Uncharacterized protein n=2 Tax=Eucalyptus grandis TaxID=71139 RepID=A0ACC3JN70_EUCGR|nr:hypothetical protein EUGRSUZ_H00904 [Eucalyptus grandis]